MRKNDTFAIFNQTKGKLPSLPFKAIKEAVLGKLYVLELVFVGTAESKKINAEYRGKNKPANTLSFSLSKNTGQIFVCPTKARKEARRYKKTPDEFIGFLFIHSLLHLEGYRHGSTMDSEETRLSTKFLGK